mgnify:CR=1 FL=1
MNGAEITLKRVGQLAPLTLQWGRAMNGAVIDIVTHHQLFLYPLQWGRAMYGAEIFFMRDKWRKYLLASMGPRHEWRGNKNNTYWGIIV